MCIYDFKNISAVLKLISIPDFASYKNCNECHVLRKTLNSGSVSLYRKPWSQSIYSVKYKDCFSVVLTWNFLNRFKIKGDILTEVSTDLPLFVCIVSVWRVVVEDDTYTSTYLWIRRIMFPNAFNIICRLIARNTVYCQNISWC